MTRRRWSRITAAALGVLVSAGCSDRDTSDLSPAPPNTDPVVFVDDFGEDVDFQAFLASNLSTLSIDTSERHTGAASLKVAVPDVDDANGNWAGGAFVTGSARDLSGYNALTFWARSSKASAMNVVGFGNDNTGTSKYTAEWHDVALMTEWRKYVIPIPLPARLSTEKGLFFLAEDAEGTTGHDVWFDDVTFETVATISNPRPAMTTQTLNAFAGTTITVSGTQVTFSVDGVDQTIQHMPGYFDFESSNEDVVAISGNEIEVVGGGSAVITARLGDVPATGQVTVIAIAPPGAPAPSPTFPAGDVISLFSDVYANVDVDTWSAGWGIGSVTDIRISGDDVKAYTNLVFAGIEFATETIDASSMSHFHLNVWAPQGTVFRVKLVDFGADGLFGGGDDREHELSFTGSSTPPLAIGSWVTLDIPLADFANLSSRGHLAQLIISGDTGTVYLDNVIFHQ